MTVKTESHQDSLGGSGRIGAAAFALCSLLIAGSVSAGNLPIGGAFIQIDYFLQCDKGAGGAYTLKPEVPKLIDQMLGDAKVLGMDTLVIQATRSRKFKSGSYMWVREAECGNLVLQVSDMFLEKAGHQGIGVYVGLGLYENWNDEKGGETNFNDLFSVENADKSTADIAKHLGDYSRLMSRSALRGWYFPDEPSLGDADVNIEMVAQYFSRWKAALGSLSVKDTLFSPYLSPYPSSFDKVPVEPKKVAERFKTLLDKTAISRIALQDSVGGYAMDVGWQQSGRKLGDYVYEIFALNGRDRFWTIAELFNHGRRYISGYGGAMLPTSIHRLNRQLSDASVAFVGKRLAWLPMQHMTDTKWPSNATYAEATRLMSSYRAMYAGAGTSLAKPVSYRWLTPPHSFYPDSTGRELMDDMPGYPRDPGHPGWVGIGTWDFDKRGEWIVDLGSSKNVRWFGVHTLNMPRYAIAAPESLTLEGSVDGKTWSALGDTIRSICYNNESVSPSESPSMCGGAGDEEFAHVSNKFEISLRCPRDSKGVILGDKCKDHLFESEYVASNSKPFPPNSVRYLKIKARLPHVAWLFLGEMEIVVAN